MNREELCTSMPLRCTTQPPRKKPWLYPKSWIQGLALLGILAVMVSIPWESMRLYQAALAHRASQVAQGAPPECSQETWTLLSSIRAYLATVFSWSPSSSVCQDYYYLLLVDPLWEVTPLVVLSSLGTRCFLHPLELLSSSLGRSVRLFFSEIPLHWQPVFLFVVVISGLILTLILSGYRLSVPLLLKLEPKKNSQSSKESKSGDLLDPWTERSFYSYDDGRDSKHTWHASEQSQLTKSPFSYDKNNYKHFHSLLAVSPADDTSRFQPSTSHNQHSNNSFLSANHSPHVKYSRGGQISTKESCKVITPTDSIVNRSKLSVYKANNLNNKNLSGETVLRQPLNTSTRTRFQEIINTPDNSYDIKKMPDNSYKDKSKSDSSYKTRNTPDSSYKTKKTPDNSFSQITPQSSSSKKPKTNKKTILKKKTNTDTLWTPKNEDYSFSDSE